MSDIEIYQHNDIDNYSPQDGLARIAVAESGENFFKRARNSDGLYEAVKTKLTEQRKFIKWWDAQPKASGARGNRSVTPPTIAELFNIADGDERAVNATTMMLSRWRKSLASDEAFQKALSDAQMKCWRICEMDKGSVRGTEGTGDNEWYTPAVYLRIARSVLGEIDVDPASNEIAQEAVKAKQYFTIIDDGLRQSWRGRVWLNPPYAQPHIQDFVEKLVAEFIDGNVTSAIMLTHNYTDTAWFQYAAEYVSAICFTRGRIRFEAPNGELASPTQGQAFFYFGQDVIKICNEFSDIGFVVEVRR
jgi:ParB family chromosome partitioning protein